MDSDKVKSFSSLPTNSGPNIYNQNYRESFQTNCSNLTIVVDFYIHYAYQRMGIGKKLFSSVLSLLNKNVVDIYFINPNYKLKSFLYKHFNIFSGVEKLIDYQNKKVVLLNVIYNKLCNSKVITPPNLEYEYNNDNEKVAKEIYNNRYNLISVKGKNSEGVKQSFLTIEKKEKYNPLKNVEILK